MSPMRAAISWPIQPRFLVPSSAFLIRQPRHLKLERRVINLRDATSTTFLQQFYNKSQVVSCYWFKFETNTKITFLP